MSTSSDVKLDTLADVHEERMRVRDDVRNGAICGKDARAFFYALDTIQDVIMRERRDSPNGIA